MRPLLPWDLHPFACATRRGWYSLNLQVVVCWISSFESLVALNTVDQHMAQRWCPSDNISLREDLPRKSVWNDFFMWWVDVVSKECEQLERKLLGVPWSWLEVVSFFLLALTLDKGDSIILTPHALVQASAWDLVTSCHWLGFAAGKRSEDLCFWWRLPLLHFQHEILPSTIPWMVVHKHASDVILI